MEEKVEYYQIDEKLLKGYVRKKGKKAIFTNGKIIEHVKLFDSIQYDLTISTKEKFDKQFNEVIRKINNQF